MDIIERVAAAMYERPGKVTAGGWVELREAAKADWRDMARAAIAALREPTEAMIEAGKRVATDALLHAIRPEKISALVYTGVQEYRAMIDAALNSDVKPA